VRIRRRKVFFESVERSIQDSNFHGCEINRLDREQVWKAAKIRQIPAICFIAKSAMARESREFLDFFQSPK
jgi:hypothetical protein